MEISGRRLLPYLPGTSTPRIGQRAQESEFPGEASSTRIGKGEDGQKSPLAVEAPRQSENGNGGITDYRQLIRQSRAEQARFGGAEAYRSPEASPRVRHALESYRSNATVSAESGELMPRIDDYV